MDNRYYCIYVEHMDNIWRFIQKDNRELEYNIMDKDKKWSEQVTIDKDVLEFDIHVEEEAIHIIYNNINNEIKYSIVKDNQYVRHLLYHVDRSDAKIQNLKIKIIEEQMHIFYLVNENNNSILMHYLWDGKEGKETPINNITEKNLKDGYKLVVNEDNNIDLVFIGDMEDEFSINYSSFKNQSWTTEKRLYRVQGNDLSIEVLKTKDNIHVLNRYKEGSIYYIDHVVIDSSGKSGILNVHKSKERLDETLLFLSENKIYSSWIEKNKIFYSEFSGETWRIPRYFNRDNEDIVKRYRLHYKSSEQRLYKEEQIYGTGESGLNWFIPSKFVVEDLQVLAIMEKEADIEEIHIDEPKIKEVFKNLELEISKVKEENKGLEKTIESLKIQLNQNQQFIKEYEERIIIISEQKRKSDENCNMFMELQNKMTSDMKSLNQQLVEERELKVDFQNKLEECEEENRRMKLEIEKLEEENKNIGKELNLERNKTLVERLFKGR